MSEASGLWWWEDFSAAPAARRKIITGFIIIAGLLLSILLIGGLAQSKIGLTDENDLPQFVGTSGHVAFSQIPRLLMEKTEVGEFGRSQRFRPIYFLGRITETALWGLNGSYWYVWRIVMFGAVIAAIFWLYTQCVGLVLGAVLTVFTLSFSMWVDIWTRSTGINEQYGSLGTAIYALGAWHFVKRWRSGLTLETACVVMAIGAIIAMGSKENMLLLEVPLFATLAFGVWYRRIGITGAIMLMLAMAFGVWIASSILVYFLHAKVEDIYGNSVRASLVYAKGMVMVYISGLIAAVSIISVRSALQKTGDHEKLAQHRALTLKYGVYGCVLAGVFIFNVVFYTGRIPSGGRYDFPAMFVLPALLILLLYSLSDTATLLGVRAVTKKQIGLVLAAGLVIYTAIVPWRFSAAVKANVARNFAFDAALNEAQRMTRQNPQWPVYIKSFNALDYEPVQALAFFFIGRGINNPRYLVYVSDSAQREANPFLAGLDQGLAMESSNGLAERGYLPLKDAQVSAGGDCYVVVLRKPEQFAIDQANGKDPKIGQDCLRIPMLIYWDGPEFRIDAG